MIRLFLLNFFFFLSCSKLFALIEVDITRGNLDPLPIAVSPLHVDIKSEETIEFAIPDLKESISLLGEIVGSKDNEDMLDLLFSNFCIGK